MGVIKSSFEKLIKTSKLKSRCFCEFFGKIYSHVIRHQKLALLFPSTSYRIFSPISPPTQLRGLQCRVSDFYTWYLILVIRLRRFRIFFQNESSVIRSRARILPIIGGESFLKSGRLVQSGDEVFISYISALGWEKIRIICISTAGDFVT